MGGKEPGDCDRGRGRAAANGKAHGPGRSVGPVLLLTISKASKSKFYRMSTNSKHLVEPDGGDALTSGPVCFSHEQV